METLIQRYKKFAKDGVNEFIITMLEKNIGNKENVFLKLCGNNHLFCKERLNDTDILIVANVLVKSAAVTGLDLRYNRISDKGAQCLAYLLKNNNVIEELNLMGNDIGEKGAKYLAESLLTNTGLKVLNMTGNKIRNKGGMQFAQALQINATLHYLDVGECDLEIDAIIALGTVTTYNTNIKGITLNRPILWTNQDEQVVHMADLLHDNRTLQEIHLTKFRITDFGAERLADSLILNYSLKILDVSSNQITRDGVEALAKLLRENTPLEILDIAFNRAQDDGAEAIADALISFNTNLKVLAISYNEISERGLCALANALEINTTLSNIYIWGNKLTTPTCEAFSKLLKDGRLTEANTDVRAYVVDDVPYLAYVEHDCDYRRFRFTVPIYGSEVPENMSYRLF